MRRHQVSVGIMAGLIFGALVALKLGNVLTAVLAGSLVAFVTTWLACLEWTRQKVNAAAVEVNQILVSAFFDLKDAPGLTKKIWHSLFSRQTWVALYDDLMAWLVLLIIVIIFVVAIVCIIPIILLSLVFCLTIRPMYRAPYLIYKHPNIRKGCYYIISLIVFSTLTAGSVVIYADRVVQLTKASGIEDSSFALMILLILPVLIGLLALSGLLPLTLVMIFSVQLYWRAAFTGGIFEPRLPDNGHYIRISPEESGVMDWYTDGMFDHTPPLKSVLHMIKVRGLNVFYLLSWLVLFVACVAINLANTKTRLAAITATVLCAIHLTIAYDKNWIAINNPNFWLSLALTMVVGGWLGQMIGKLTEAKLWLDCPRFRQLHHYDD